MPSTLIAIQAKLEEILTLQRQQQELLQTLTNTVVAIAKVLDPPPEPKKKRPKASQNTKTRHPLMRAKSIPPKRRISRPLNH